MKRIAYFDVFVGVSGDMVLGALVDAGVPLGVIRETVDSLGLDGVQVDSRSVEKVGIQATKVDVRVPHEHVHRGLNDITGIIRGAGLPGEVEAGAIQVFERLATAEAAVHGTTVEEVHFHEVGALDAIADIVGAVAGLHHLGVDEVQCSPIPLSSGFATCAHGRIPVPPPAVVELLRGVPVKSVDVVGETVTPTGAALMVGLAHAWAGVPEMMLTGVGYGAGDYDYPLPNLLRLMLGETAEAVEGETLERLALLETNVDDMTPEWLGPLIGTVLEAGALDAWMTPTLMKKGRQGTTISVLVGLDAVTRVRSVLYTETTTLGVRETVVARTSLARESVAVDTTFGTIRVKVATTGDGRRKPSPEFEDCVASAREHGVTFQEVFAAALAEWMNSPR